MRRPLSHLPWQPDGLFCQFQPSIEDKTMLTFQIMFGVQQPAYIIGTLIVENCSVGCNAWKSQCSTDRSYTVLVLYLLLPYKWPKLNILVTLVLLIIELNHF